MIKNSYNSIHKEAGFFVCYRFKYNNSLDSKHAQIWPMQLLTLIKNSKFELKEPIQIKSDETAQLLNKPYVNDVYLTRQNLT